jgi:23S rRNA pseudouridine2457 synthase
VALFILLYGNHRETEVFSKPMSNPTHRHFLVHKPFGYLSQFINNQTKRKNQKMLGELGEFPEGTMSIGRLDKDSEGLLLLTTDGKTSARITGRKVEKEYWVQVDGQLTEEAVAELRSGVDISVNKEIYRTLPAEVAALAERPGFPERSRKVRDDRHGPTSWVSIIIREGKFRQVRKMTAAAGFPTLRLVRVRIGEIRLGDFEPGKVLEISSEVVGEEKNRK